MGILYVILVVVYSLVEALVKLIVPVPRKSIAGQNVLITGGGGGLGKQLALSFARAGCRIILVDVDEEANERAAALVKSLKLFAQTYVCDCSDEDEVRKVAIKIREEIGFVHILVNNAGILNGRSITMLSEREIRKAFDVNVLAQFWMIKAFLPGMMERNQGHIVTISSTAGLCGTQYLTDYAATKHALVGLNESLYLELREQGFTGIHTTCVCPNFINTGMSWFPKTNVPRLVPILNAADVAEEIVDAVRINCRKVVLPRILKHAYNGKCLLPHRAYLAIYDYLGIGIEPHDQRKRPSSKKTSHHS